MADDSETLKLFYEDVGFSRNIGQITELLYNKFVILYLKEVLNMAIFNNYAFADYTGAVQSQKKQSVVNMAHIDPSHIARCARLAMILKVSATLKLGNIYRDRKNDYL